MLFFSWLSQSTPLDFLALDSTSSSAPAPWHTAEAASHLREGQQGLPLDVAPDLVNRGGQLVDLLPDVWEQNLD